jgi:hypothetical protein
MWVSGQRHATAALCPGERTPGTHCTGGWVGPRTGLDTEVRGKIHCPAGDRTPIARSSSPQSDILLTELAGSQETNQSTQFTEASCGSPGASAAERSSSPEGRNYCTWRCWPQTRADSSERYIHLGARVLNGIRSHRPNEQALKSRWLTTSVADTSLLIFRLMGLQGVHSKCYIRLLLIHSSPWGVAQDTF